MKEQGVVKGLSLMIVILLAGVGCNKIQSDKVAEAEAGMVEPAQPAGESSAVVEAAPKAGEPSAVVEAVPPAAKPTEPEKAAAGGPEDKSRVLAALNGKALTAGEVEVMVEHRVAPDKIKAVERWIEIELKAAEARRRGLDQRADSEFILQLFADNYLANRILDQDIAEKIPEVTEEEARKYHEDNLERYQKPMRAEVQHINVLERDAAQKIAEEARQGEAKFDELVERYAQGPDKSKKGLLPEMTYEALKVRLGQEVADAVKSAKDEEVLGPLAGLKGFEVVKIQSITPVETMEFDKVKENIKRMLKAQKTGEVIRNTVAELKARAEIVKSQEVLEAEKQEEQGPKPQPGPSSTKPAGPAQERRQIVIDPRQK